MSLETAAFIKALVASNPEGTDPKSQGDDHLRLIKAVLQSQFSGLTEGKPILLTETQINDAGGILADHPARNIDAGGDHLAWYGVIAGTTGTLPPGGVVANGDVLLTLGYNAQATSQVYFVATGMMWRRYWTGTAWTQWLGIQGLGYQQTWHDVGGQRVIGQGYQNTRQRPIMVNAGAVLNANLILIGAVDGANMVFSNTASSIGGLASVSLVVPPGSYYAVTQNSGATPAVFYWTELY